MKKRNDILTAFLLCAAVAVLILYSPKVKGGAQSGIALCENIILPSLLPVLIMCNLAVGSRCRNGFDFLFGKAVKRLLRLPEGAASAILLGLVGGYPAGVLLTHSLVQTGVITKSQAKRMARFNFSGGVAFTISAVGGVCYGSIKTGALLYLCTLLSSLLCAFLCRFEGDAYPAAAQPCTVRLTDALPTAVEKSVRALALMAAYIIFFSAVIRIVPVPAWLTPLLEITAGVCTRDTLLPLPYCCFFLTFGGLCVHLQLFPYLREMGINYGDFLTGRLFCGMLSYGLCKGWLLLFPESAAVYSNLSSPVHHISESGLAVSALMVVGCAVAVFDLENRKIKLR